MIPNEILTTLFTLLILFQLKHFLCDFVFQSEWMLKKGADQHWILPLAAHVMTHTIGTLVICIIIAPELSFLALADGTIHFLIDRVKAKSSQGITPSSKRFWVFLGVDQMLHHFSHYFLIALMFVYLYGGQIIWK